MRILFLTHAFNSLSQRLMVALKAQGHEVSVELDISDTVTAEAVALFKPDLLLEQAGRSWVLDTKWKLLDVAAVSDKYGLSQADFYQMFAYGQKYLAGRGDMLLIYPRTERFQKPLPLFEFSPELRLQVVPFDLENGILCLDDLIELPLAAGGR